MATLLLGKPVADAITAQLQCRVAQLKNDGITPCLAILRVGDEPAAVSYERGAEKRAALVGVAVQKHVLPQDATAEAVLARIDRLNDDPLVHGVLMFRPLPGHLKDRQNEICNRLLPQKDVDGMTHLSAAGVFEGANLGFAPCTPVACMKILEHYGIRLQGKNVALIGRSLVVGKPLAMLLMGKHATVTVCHTRTKDVADICRRADIIVSAAGALKSLTKDHVRPGQTVIDVSINFDPQKPNASGALGALAGDADFDAVEKVAEAITPVPGGVGSVTTAVLMEQVVCAASGAKENV